MISSLYLRLSVTDHCNLRCVYCRPPGITSLQTDGLEGDQLIRAACLANHVVPLRKLRLTGGDPLLRHDLVDIVQAVRSALPDTTLTLTTNGVLLAEHAASLRLAGLDALNVSLDTIDPVRFHHLTGAPLLHHVIDGLAAAREAGFKRIKINTVLLEDGNGDHLVDLVQFTLRFSAEIRFIELMPSGPGASIHARSFLPAQLALERLKTKLRYEGPIGRTGTASRHHFRDGNRVIAVGFITSVSEPFCSDCNRLRIDSRGRLYGCLRSEHHTDLRPGLLEQDEAFLIESFRSMLRQKAGLSKHWLNRPMAAIGG